MGKLRRMFHGSAVFILALALSAAHLSPPAFGASPPAFGAKPALTSAPSDPLATNPVSAQFMLGGQIFGAQPGGVYLTSARHALHIDFESANPVQPVSSPTATDEAAAARTSLPALTQVTWSNLWQGVSLTYQSAADGLAESVYTLAPGADPANIRLRYHTAVQIGADGTLVSRLADGQISESAPIAWQEIAGQRLPVQVTFSLRESTDQSALVGFTLSGYNPAYNVTIDPTLIWTSFMGSTEEDDMVAGIASDNTGSLFVCGSSREGWGYSKNPHAGHYDAFVSKVDANGNVAWNTFLGTTGHEWCNGIAIDSSNNIFITGETNVGWDSSPGLLPFDFATAQVFVTKLNSDGTILWNGFIGGKYGDKIAVSGNDVYVVSNCDTDWGIGGTPLKAKINGFLYDTLVVKLNATSGALVWNTFLGGGTTNLVKGIAVDKTGAVLVTGESWSTWGASPRRAFTAPTTSGAQDVYVAKLSAAGALVWNTFLGSGGADISGGVASDGTSNVYLVGSSESGWGGLKAVRSFGTGAGNASDLFVAKLNASGDLQWNTFQGAPTAKDTGNGITVSATGIIHVTGESNAVWSNDRPILGIYQLVFAAELNPAGGLVWHKLFGGSWANNGIAITQDSLGNTVVAGRSHASWGAPNNAFTGNVDVFVAQFSPTGVLNRNTFMGGQPQTQIMGMALDSSGNIYVCGRTNAPWTNTLNAVVQAQDGFAAKLDPNGLVLWTTYLGGPGDDGASGIWIAPSGNVLVTGFSSSTWGTPKRAYSTLTDVFAASLNGASGALQWNTFLGGSAYDQSAAITSDPSGNVYVAGMSNVSWGSSPVRGFSGSNDGFVVQLDGTGGGLLWLTFLGGLLNDVPTAIAADKLGHVLVAGVSGSAWGLPATRPFSGSQAGFVTSLAAPTGAQQWITFLGGTSITSITTLVLDSNNAIFVCGDTWSSWGTPRQPFIPDHDTYIAKIDQAGALVWNTYIGSGNLLAEPQMAMSGNGDFFIAGNSYSTWGKPLQPYSGKSAVALVKLSASGYHTEWNTFMGGKGDSSGATIAVNPNNGRVFVGGSSSAAWGIAPPAGGSFTFSVNGFVAKVNPNFYSYLPVTIH